MALTRARVTLSIPKSIKTLLQDLDRIHYLVETLKKDAAKSYVNGKEESSMIQNYCIICALWHMASANESLTILR